MVARYRYPNQLETFFLNYPNQLLPALSQVGFFVVLQELLGLLWLGVQRMQLRVAKGWECWAPTEVPSQQPERRVGFRTTPRFARRLQPFLWGFAPLLRIFY